MKTGQTYKYIFQNYVVQKDYKLNQRLLFSYQ